MIVVKSNKNLRKKLLKDYMADSESDESVYNCSSASDIDEDEAEEMPCLQTGHYAKIVSRLFEGFYATVLDKSF